MHTPHPTPPLDLRGRTLYFMFQPGCGACEAAEPVFDAVAKAHPLVMALKLNVNGAPAARVGVRIRATPTWIFRIGDKAAVKEGTMTFEQVMAWIAKAEKELSLENEG